MTRTDAALAWSLLFVACGEPRPTQELALAQPAQEPAPEAVPPAAPPVANGQGSATPEPAKPDADAAPTPDATAAVAALARSDAPLKVKVKVDDNAGFRLERLTAMYALAATPGRPGFGAPLTEPARAQDDDLLTVATCSPGQAGEPCALGLALAPGSSVTMLRLFLAGGPDYRDYVGAPRPKRLAIHTDAGRVELDYPDGATERWLIFAEPVTTAGVSIEVLAVYPGRKDAPLHFAEVEVYGTAGPARPALDIDPEDTFVYFETESWKAKGGDQYTIKMTWLEYLVTAPLGEPSPRRRWIRGAVAHGRRGDRFVLIERGLSATCDAPDVGYLLIDRETRMVYPLGPLAGGAATIYRHALGTGFLAAPPGADAIAGIRTVEFDPETKRFERRRGKPAWTLDDHLREWNFDPGAARRGGRDLDAFVADPDSHCEALSGPGLDQALAASKVLFPIAPGEWWSCAIGDGHTALLGRDSACGEVASLLLKPPGGDIVRVAEFAAGDGPRRIAVERQIAFPGLLVEVGKRNGISSDLVPLNIDYHKQSILRDASLVARPPGECGACELEYAATRNAAAALPAPPDDQEVGAAPDPADSSE